MTSLNLISEVCSLMMFQERVLKKGTPSASNYSMEELSNLLDFNDIFLNNTDEMFTKYDCSSVAKDYVKLLNLYIKNISFIIYQMMRINSDNMFTYESSFEKRMKEVLSIRKRFSISNMNIKDINKLYDGIYFISINDIHMSCIEVDKSLYENIFHDGNIYWKTDDCILDYFNNFYNGSFIAIKITTKDDHITKIEYNGDKEVIMKLLPYIDDSVLVVSNVFLFIGDIKLMMKSFIGNNTKSVVSEIKHLEALDIIDHDELIEYPLDSFANYLDFLLSAVDNPETKEINLTLYRIGSNPAIFNILRKAINKGIDVNVNIELEASGEWINELWADEMAKSGINVYTYKTGKLKVHSKLTLVIFINGTMIAQIGTGNYHTETTSQYTDLSLITADQDICKMIYSVFDMFKNESDKCKLNKDFIVTGTKNTNIDILTKLIDEQSKLGKEGYICFKCNSLSDNDIIEHLNNAALNGCSIDLIVRGICTWVPRCNNVTIRSIVWNKLEHSRVYSFNRKNPIIYIGSLDLVTNKINKRIETLVRVKDPRITIQLCKYLNRYLTDNNNSWIMQKDGSYAKEV